MRPFGDLPFAVDPPGDINVLVTASTGALPLGVSLDAAGHLAVDRLYHTAMRCPGNLGLIPRTVGEDGRPLTALVAGEHALAPGLVVGARPIGVLYVSGADGEEMVVLCVPAARLTARYDSVVNYKDLPQGELRTIANFVLHYRDVEEAARPRTAGWGDVSEAHRVVSEAAARQAERAR
ncbi:inorganic diphosphatase [Acuticoccus yangtzensis]|uniref:inorganic diphosphatase n=1 Tax=Acuticoccus yangtzensis TaxID=1443441 RepID=UPI0009F98DEB|nr:inorganic diphosphatase [Acuticoccus yangtzensis]